MLPFLLQDIASARIEARIDAGNPEIIAAAQSQVGTPLQAIAVLTDLLPDDTYLTLLGAPSQTCHRGRSTTAMRLIGAMAAHRLIQNPAFVAPMIRDETTGTTSRLRLWHSGRHSGQSGEGK